MDIKATVALIAAASAIGGGIVTAILGPTIKHGLEQSAANKARRREQIQKWRAMVLQIDRESRAGAVDVTSALQLHPDFLSLQPHLTESARESVHKRFFLVQIGHALPIHLRVITDEISRIEKDWKL